MCLSVSRCLRCRCAMTAADGTMMSISTVSYELSHITYVWKNDEDTLRKSPSLTTLNAYLIQNATTTCPIKASWRGKFEIYTHTGTHTHMPTKPPSYYCATYFNHIHFIKMNMDDGMLVHFRQHIRLCVCVCLLGYFQFHFFLLSSFDWPSVWRAYTVCFSFFEHMPHTEQSSIYIVAACA